MKNSKLKRCESQNTANLNNCKNKTYIYISVVVGIIVFLIANALL